MALSSRAAELQRAVTAMEITDAAGSRVDAEAGMSSLVEQVEALRARGGTLYLVGNGGSAGIASHSVTDFVKAGRVRATTLHDSALITCMSNDYGYDVAYARILEVVASPDDVLLAISSSGQSENIRNASIEMRRRGGKVVTFSGFRSDNPLRSLGDLNVWLDSSDYGIVEIGHQFVIHNLADRIRLRTGQ